MRGSQRRLAANELRVDPTASVSCVNLLYVTALTLVVITALSRYGFPTLSFAAVSGAVGVCGEVIDIQVFATTISAEDGRRVIIPNGSITGGSITNHSVR